MPKFDGKACTNAEKVGTKFFRFNLFLDPCWVCALEKDRRKVAKAIFSKRLFEYISRIKSEPPGHNWDHRFYIYLRKDQDW